jgi:hypothetical protein
MRSHVDVRLSNSDPHPEIQDMSSWQGRYILLGPFQETSGEVDRKYLTM